MVLTGPGSVMGQMVVLPVRYVNRTKRKTLSADLLLKTIHTMLLVTVAATVMSVPMELFLPSLVRVLIRAGPVLVTVAVTMRSVRSAGILLR